MRVCIPTTAPGGLDSSPPKHFDLMEVIDYYDLEDDGSFEHTAETRYCGGGCFDVVEAMVRRETKALVVNNISPSTYRRFVTEGVKVYFADGRTSRVLLVRMSDGTIQQLDPMTQTSRL